MLKKVAKKILSNKTLAFIRSVKDESFDGYSKKSYSQEGEDLILMRVLGQKQFGFYVDVGAHHPKRFSNTYIFYKMGWRGINIDAKPDSMKLFMAHRPRDINLEIPISENSEVLKYYMFREPALNGFSKEVSESRSRINGDKIESILELKTERLEKILDEYLPKNTEIDFLTVDVEGLDFEVIRSLNLNRYRPNFILIEALESNLNTLTGSELAVYLSEYNYVLYAKAVNTVFFKKECS